MPETDSDYVKGTRSHPDPRRDQPSPKRRCVEDEEYHQALSGDEMNSDQSEAEDKMNSDQSEVEDEINADLTPEVVSRDRQRDSGGEVARQLERLFSSMSVDDGMPQGVYDDPAPAEAAEPVELFGMVVDYNATLLCDAFCST